MFIKRKLNVLIHTYMKTNEGRELHSVYCKALLRLKLAKKVQNEITFHKENQKKVEFTTEANINVVVL